MTPSTHRRVIPPGYVVAELTLIGESPLLMSSAEFDRTSDTYRAFRNLSKKRARSLEDDERLRELEWITRLYYDAQVGVYIPGRAIKEVLREAATKWRMGEELKRSLIVPEYRVPLKYEGPTEPKELYEAKDELGKRRFVDTRLAKNAGAGSGSVERTRPCFEDWSIVCDIAFDPEDLNLEIVEMAVERARKYGIGDYRPDFGAFRSGIAVLRTERGETNADRQVARDPREEAAVKAAVKRITKAQDLEVNADEAEANGATDDGKAEEEEVAATE